MRASSPTGASSSPALPEPLELPTDRPRPPVPSYRGDSRAAARCRAELHAQALEALAAGGRARLFMVLLAALAALLHRGSGPAATSPSARPIAGRTAPSSTA